MPPKNKSAYLSSVKNKIELLKRKTKKKKSKAIRVDKKRKKIAILKKKRRSMSRQPLRERPGQKPANPLKSERKPVKPLRPQTDGGPGKWVNIKHPAMKNTKSLKGGKGHYGHLWKADRDFRE